MQLPVAYSFPFDSGCAFNAAQMARTKAPPAAAIDEIRRKMLPGGGQCIEIAQGAIHGFVDDHSALVLLARFGASALYLVDENHA